MRGKNLDAVVERLTGVEPMIAFSSPIVLAPQETRSFLIRVGTLATGRAANDGFFGTMWTSTLWMEGLRVVTRARMSVASAMELGFGIMYCKKRDVSILLEDVRNGSTHNRIGLGGIGEGGEGSDVGVDCLCG